MRGIAHGTDFESEVNRETRKCSRSAGHLRTRGYPYSMTRRCSRQGFCPLVLKLQRNWVSLVRPGLDDRWRMERGKYGQAAVDAVESFRSALEKGPRGAWSRAVARLFPKSPSSRDKGCPMYAFLGLCGEGLVRGIPPGDYRVREEQAIRSRRSSSSQA